MLATIASCYPRAEPPLLTRAVPKPSSAQSTAWSSPKPEARARQDVVARARQLLDASSFEDGNLRFPRDPVGYLRAAYWTARIDLFDATVAADDSLSGVEVLFKSAKRRNQLHEHSPRPGDLVFFAASPSDGTVPVHATIVERVDNHGTICTLGLFASGAERICLNLRQPDELRSKNGALLNSELNELQPATAARLFRKFANPFGD